MAKRLIHVLVILIIVLAGAVSYLAAITLPVSINAMVVDELKRLTQKNVLVESIRFDLIKGLVLEDLVIYDNDEIFIWAKGVSCGIELLSLVQNRIEISPVTVDSPAVYLERRTSGEFNILELIPANYGSDAAASAFNGLIVKNARAIFVDRTLAPAFRRRVDDIYMDIRYLPQGKIALNLSCSVPRLKGSMHFKFSGVYNLTDRSLAGRLGVKGLELDEFKDYYKEANISFPSGALDADAALTLKDDDLDLNIDGRAKGLSVNKDALRIKLDSLVKLMVRYGLKDKALEYAGKLGVESMDLSGIEGLGRLEDIKADIEFDDSRLWSRNIIADAYGMRWKARVNILNFTAPIVDIYADSDTHLSVIKKTLAEEFNIKLPTDISGKANVKAAIHIHPSEPLKIDGFIALSGATISLGHGSFPVDHIAGEAQFNLDGIKWSGMKLEYRQMSYVASGNLKDFAHPMITLEASSRDFAFKSDFSVIGPAIKISRLDGKYLSSTFSASGEIAGALGQNKARADIIGEVELDLSDLQKILKNQAISKEARPSGKIHTSFSLSGDAADLKACDIRAKIKSAGVSIYNFKLTDIIADYVQSKGMAQVKSLRAGFYGGSLFASGKINWLAKALPSSINFDVKDVKLESLMADRGFTDNKVSGNVKAFANLTGAFKGAGHFTGIGRVSISNGRLWQLNLFKGVGALIFSDDFSDIMFTDGSCDIKIAPKGLIVNNLILKSEPLYLYGAGTIRFDKSIDAMLRPEIREGAIYSETRSALAMAVSSNTIINITGAIGKPEYKSQTCLTDVACGIAEAMFKR